jgi:hypothetical protein
MAKRTNKTVEPKELKLVCKCGSCTHWEIVLQEGGKDSDGYATKAQYIICVACGLELDCYFSMGPHEGVHYEKHVKGDEKLADECNAVAAAQ